MIVTYCALYMLKSQCMKNIQKVWLMFLSAVLLLALLITLLVSIDWSRKKCVINGVEYSSGQEITGYLENAKCFCNSKGKIDCSLEDTSKSLLESSDFTTKNLEFNAQFLNSLSNAEINISNEIIFRSVSQSDGGLKVVVERLDLCTGTNVIPDQVGFFNLSNNDLVLTAIETGDPSKFTEPCIIENTFVLTKLTGKLDDSFKIYFRDENDDVYLSDMCVYEGRVHNEGDAYRSDDLTLLCTCEDGDSVCNPI